MKIRNFGTQGLKTSQLGLGCMGMSEFYGATNDSESIKVIHRALDLGVTFFDTADMYGPYINEELVGKALHGQRNQVMVATKFGFVRNHSDPTSRSINGKPEYVVSACDASLKRLKFDVIDLYYQHRVDPATPIEETVGAMAALVKAGKIKAIGLSEVSVATLRRAHKVHPVTAVQSEYSLWSREPEDGMLAACRELGVAFVPYSPLGRGFLTGKLKNPDELDAKDFRRIAPRFQGGNFEKNLQLVGELELLARKKSCTVSQLALAWVIAQGDYVFPIPGTKKMNYLEENVRAVDLSFTPDELTELDTVSPKGVASGQRYAEAGMKIVNG